MLGVAIRLDFAALFLWCLSIHAAEASQPHGRRSEIMLFCPKQHIIQLVETVTATQLKRRLGELLDRACLQKVAVERHGRVVAYLVPARAPRAPRARPRAGGAPVGLTRAAEERVLRLVAGGDLRPSRWRRAGEPRTMAGMAALLAAAGVLDRQRLFALAEQLHPGMSTVAGFDRWLGTSGVEPSRLLSMVKAMREARG